MTKNFKVSILFWLALWPGLAAGTENWTVAVKVVNGKMSYSHTQASPLEKQTNFSGKARVRGLGPAGEMSFDSYLNSPQNGLFRLDYQVEIAGGQPARPPFQAAGKVLLRPGRPVLAAEVGGWKLILELQGTAGGKFPKPDTAVLETKLKCGRVSYPADFVYLPEQQYSAVLYNESGDTVRKFVVGLLPNSPGIDGTFRLQYTLLLKEGGETLASGGGKLVLSPGGEKATAAAGKDCVFSAKAR